METKEFFPAVYNVIFKNVCIDDDFGKSILGLILSTIFDRKIIVKRYIVPTLPQRTKEEKEKNLDVLVETDYGYMVVEMNNGDLDKSKMYRNYMYLMSYASQKVLTNDKYNPTICYTLVNLNANCNKTSDPIEVFEYQHNNEVCILDNIKIYNANIDSLENLCYNYIELTDKYRYLLMLKLEKEALDSFYPEDKYVRRFKEIVMRINDNIEFYWGVTPEKDREMLHKAQLEEKYDDGFANGEKRGFAKGEKSGEKNANIKTAKRLHKLGIPLETISEGTTLSMQELSQIVGGSTKTNPSDVSKFFDKK